MSASAVEAMGGLSLDGASAPSTSGKPMTLLVIGTDVPAYIAFVRF